MMNVARNASNKLKGTAAKKMDKIVFLNIVILNFFSSNYQFIKCAVASQNRATAYTLI